MFRSEKIYDCINELNLAFGLNLYNFEIVDNLGGVSYFVQYCLGIEEGRLGINLLAFEGKNLLTLWSHSGCVEKSRLNEFSFMNILTNFRNNEGGFHYDPTTLPYRFSCYDAMPIRSLRPFELLKVPIFIPKSDIDKYSNFEIRKRNSMPKINYEFANELLMLYIKCTEYTPGYFRYQTPIKDNFDYNDLYKYGEYINKQNKK